MAETKEDLIRWGMDDDARDALLTVAGFVCTTCGKPAAGVGAQLDPSHRCAQEDDG